MNNWIVKSCQPHRGTSGRGGGEVGWGGGGGRER